MIDLNSELNKHADLFFSYKTVSETITTVQKTIPADLTYFNGHFVNISVLPAVAIIDITVYYLHFLKLIPIGSEIKKLNYLKIKSAVGPNDRIDIQIEKKLNSNGGTESFLIGWQTDLPKQEKICELSINFTTYF